jgi:hypothetical protein
MRLPKRQNTAAIDNAGMILPALALTGLVLMANWGETQYPWMSATILSLAAATVVLTAAFVLVETRAAEPVIPMRLFRNRTFTVTTHSGSSSAPG